MMEKEENIVVILAIFLLSMGLASGVYLQQIKLNSETMLEEDSIEIDGTSFSIDTIFSHCPLETYATDDGNYTGVLLSHVINFSGITNPNIYGYSIIGADGYKKTVSWDDMKNGILTDTRYTVFIDLPRAYWIHNVVGIEVE